MGFQSGRELSGSWNAESYDLSVHGPNGFLRRFAGKTDNRVEAEAHVKRGVIWLTLINKDDRAVRFSIADGYGSQAREIRVRPNGRASHRVLPLRTSHWHDLTITCDTGTDFVRRLAGHAETGSPGYTDPAIKVR